MCQSNPTWDYWNFSATWHSAIEQHPSRGILLPIPWKISKPFVMKELLQSFHINIKQAHVYRISASSVMHPFDRKMHSLQITNITQSFAMKWAQVLWILFATKQILQACTSFWIDPNHFYNFISLHFPDVMANPGAWLRSILPTFTTLAPGPSSTWKSTTLAHPRSLSPAHPDRPGNSLLFLPGSSTGKTGKREIPTAGNPRTLMVISCSGAPKTVPESRS